MNYYEIVIDAKEHNIIWPAHDGKDYLPITFASVLFLSACDISSGTTWCRKASVEMKLPVIRIDEDDEDGGDGLKDDHYRPGHDT